MNSLSVANKLLANAFILHEQASPSIGSEQLGSFDSDSHKPRSRTSQEGAGPSGFWQTRQLRRACKSDGLCPQCKAIFSDGSHFEALLSSEGYAHLEPRQVHEGKDAGCKLCAALHQRIQDLDCRKSQPLRLRASLGDGWPSFHAHPKDILKIRSLAVSVIDSKTPLKLGERFQQFHLLTNIRLFSIQGRAL